MFRVWSLCALVLSYFACKASAEAVKWPSDSAIRQWALEKRGLALFGDGHAQQLALLKVTSLPKAGHRERCGRYRERAHRVRQTRAPARD